jgi:hypothetical protein
MTDRTFQRLGNVDEVGFAPGGNRDRRFEPQCRRAGDRESKRSWRHRGSGHSPVGRQAASGSNPGGSRRGAVPGPCHPAAELPVVRGSVSGQGLPPASDRHPVRPCHAASATLPLCRLRHEEGRCQLASVLPISSWPTCPPSCPIVLRPACSSTFCRSIPGSATKACAAAP